MTYHLFRIEKRFCRILRKFLIPQRLPRKAVEGSPSNAVAHKKTFGDQRLEDGCEITCMRNGHSTEALVRHRLFDTGGDDCQAFDFVQGTELRTEAFVQFFEGFRR